MALLHITAQDNRYFKKNHTVQRGTVFAVINKNWNQDTGLS